MKLSLPVCRAALHRELRPLLSEIGYKGKGQGEYFKPNPLGTEILRFPDRRDDDYCYFTLHLALSIAAVEKVYRPNSEDLLGTIFLPLHFLHEGRRSLEWKMSSVDDAPAVAEAVMREMHQYGLPFFEQYSDLEEIKRNLRSSDRKAGFSLGYDQIACVLATLEYLDGEVGKAFEVLEVAIAKEEEKPIPRNYSMKKFLAQLREREASEAQ